MAAKASTEAIDDGMIQWARKSVNGKRVAFLGLCRYRVRQLCASIDSQAPPSNDNNGSSAGEALLCNIGCRIRGDRTGVIKRLTACARQLSDKWPADNSVIVPRRVKERARNEAGLRSAHRAGSYVFRRPSSGLHWSRCVRGRYSQGPRDTA